MQYTRKCKKSKFRRQVALAIAVGFVFVVFLSGAAVAIPIDHSAHNHQQSGSFNYELHCIACALIQSAKNLLKYHYIAQAALILLPCIALTAMFTGIARLFGVHTPIDDKARMNN
ncbi:MAG: hypothetical protein FWH20_10080 [Oscillospiraceae bacterium]|nr:hypothetical protein [Oscillospiraceae bacterium]